MLVVGDSHAQKLTYSFQSLLGHDHMGPERHYSEFQDQEFYINEIGEHRRSLSSMHRAQNKDIDLIISSHPGKSALKFDFMNFGRGSQKYFSDQCNNKDTIIFPWFGYIDVKDWLPDKKVVAYKSPKEIASSYINNVLKAYDKSRVIVVEPMPQFITFVSARWADFSNDRDFSFEERYEMHKELFYEMCEYSKKIGLEDPISISSILGTDMINIDKQIKSPLSRRLNDHMSTHEYEPILKYMLGYLK